MQKSSFILGVALLIVATTLAITITMRRAPGSAASSDRPASRDGGSPESSQTSPDPRSGPSSSPRTSKSEPREGVERGRFDVSVPRNHPQSATLAEKARKVEAEAMGHLERLTKRLDLTAEQRRRLFPILARTAKDYDPALVITGAGAGAPALAGSAGNKEVNKVLEPDQRDQLVENAMEDQILWQEIIDKLQRRLEAETPQVPAVDPAEAEPAAPATPRRRGNLFENVEPTP